MQEGNAGELAAPRRHQRWCTTTNCFPGKLIRSIIRWNYGSNGVWGLEKIMWRVGTGTILGEKKKKRKIQVHTVGAAHKVLEATRRAHNKSDVK